jgi:hypothetical protein
MLCSHASLMCYHHRCSTIFEFSVQFPDILHSHYVINIRLYQVVMDFVAENMLRPQKNWNTPLHFSWDSTSNVIAIACQLIPITTSD